MLPALNRHSAEISRTYPERIVQFGGGNFLRGFVDWMVDILNEQTDFASSVVIVKLTAQGSYEALDAQDGLFHTRLHTLEAGELVTRTRLITCVSRSVNPYQDFEALLSLARQPEIRFIVSNTTEMGIAFDPESRFEDRPPAAFPAKLTRFLYERYRHFAGSAETGCILLPCELIEQNGNRLRQIVLQYADAWELEPGFADWVAQNNQFCNTLVDRIVTGFPQRESAAVLAQLGFDDALLVEGEWYHSWIIEAPAQLHEEFPVRQTDLNVRIVDDARAYRELKVRILNGAHTAMVPPGCFLGLTTVREAVEHPALGAFLRDLVYAEIVPSLPYEEAPQYADAVLARFRNPFIQHRLSSIALNMLSKFKARLLPTLIAYQSKYGQLPPRVVLAFAALLRFYRGEWDGQALPVQDDAGQVAWFRRQWEAGQTADALAAALLGNEALWGADLNTIPGLTAQIARCLERIDGDGILAAIQDLNQTPE
jgi:tagaturonate reductase